MVYAIFSATAAAGLMNITAQRGAHHFALLNFFFAVYGFRGGVFFGEVETDVHFRSEGLEGDAHEAD